MTLNAQVALRVEGQISLEIGAMQLMTAQAGDGLIGSLVDYILADRM